MTRMTRLAPSLFVLIVAVVVLLAGPTIVQRIQHSYTITSVRQARNELGSLAILEEMNTAMRLVSQAVEPSVVHINVNRLDPNNRRGELEFSTGSGWVYDSAGHIITNEHVIADAKTIEVRFHDGTPRSAVLVGSDEKTDIAVLQVNTKEVIPAILAEHDHPEQGELVFAFGSPFGFEFSMTTGIISGRKRQTRLSYLPNRYENYIQIDATINPGNSGGPLTDIHGHVVGMNVSIAVDGRRPNTIGGQAVSGGVGFAIPLDMIRFVADQLIENGTVHRGGLGVYLANLTREQRLSIGYNGNGILITNVDIGSPAHQAGLLRNDIITSIDDEPISSVDSFRTSLHTKSPGTTVILNINRYGRVIEHAVTLGDWDAMVSRLPEETVSPTIIRSFNPPGVTLTQVTEDLSNRLGLPIDYGLYIQNVEVGSLAWDLGFKAGAVIIIMDGKLAQTLDEFADMLGSRSAQQGLWITVMYDDGKRSELWFRLPVEPSDDDSK